MYSFGVVLWELLHGARPWVGYDEAALVMAVAIRMERPPVTAADSVLRQLMESCWVHSPEDRPTFVDVEARLARATRTFEASTFRRLYAALAGRAEPISYEELLVGVKGLILEHAQRHGISAHDANIYFNVVRDNTLLAAAHGQHGADAVNELLRDPARLAVRMYTTAETLPANSPNDGRELCSILNETLREDKPTHAIIFTRALNSFCVTGRTPGSLPVRWPPGNEVWRGGALPAEHHHFFTVGKTFRVPSFLSTSATQATADQFMQGRGMHNGRPAYVRWTIRFDASRRCNHVNFISVHDGSLAPGGLNAPGANPHVAREDEFLFAPYSVFTIISVLFRDHPTSEQPHEIVLRASVDNLLELMSLENAPWV
jgi:hypothetical protein